MDQIIMRECKICHENKQLHTQYKRNKHLYSKDCKKCHLIRHRAYFSEYHIKNYVSIKEMKKNINNIDID